MMKGISIIIPTYNRQKFIEEAIQSVFDQEYDGNLEVIISDDGSTDRTLEIAKSFGNRLTILIKGKDCLSQGVSSTRNRGLNAATQPYVCFLDSDDFFLPDHLNRLASVLESNSKLGFVFCRTLEVKEENGLRLFKRWTQQHISKNDILDPVCSGKIVNTNCFLFRRIVFDKIGCFNEAYSTGEDRDMWMRISEKYRGAFVDHYGAVYRRQHGDSQLTNNPNGKPKKDILAIYANAIDRYYQMGLDDRNLIFKLKHLLLYNEYGNVKFLYASKYLYLICKYPIPFIKKFLSFFYRMIQEKKSNHWDVLSYFIKT